MLILSFKIISMSNNVFIYLTSTLSTTTPPHAMFARLCTIITIIFNFFELYLGYNIM